MGQFEDNNNIRMQEATFWKLVAQYRALLMHQQRESTTFLLDKCSSITMRVCVCVCE